MEAVYNLPVVGRVSWIGAVYCTGPARHLITAGLDADDLQIVMYLICAECAIEKKMYERK